jgi:hypothetical protein
MYTASVIEYRGILLAEIASSLSARPGSGFIIDTGSANSWQRSPEDNPISRYKSDSEENNPNNLHANAMDVSAGPEFKLVYGSGSATVHLQPEISIGFRNGQSLTMDLGIASETPGIDIGEGLLGLGFPALSAFREQRTFYEALELGTRSGGHHDDDYFHGGFESCYPLVGIHAPPASIPPHASSFVQWALNTMFYRPLLQTPFPVENPACVDDLFVDTEPGKGLFLAGCFSPDQFLQLSSCTTPQDTPITLSDGVKTLSVDHAVYWTVSVEDVKAKFRSTGETQADGFLRGRPLDATMSHGETDQESQTSSSMETTDMASASPLWAMLDSGTNHIGIRDEDMYYKIMDQIRQKYDCDVIPSTDAAVVGGVGGPVRPLLPLCSCTTHGLSAFPDISITLRDRHNGPASHFTLYPEDYVAMTVSFGGDAHCVPAIMKTSFGATSPLSDYAVILGSPFFRRYSVVFDPQGQQIHVAPNPIAISAGRGAHDQPDLVFDIHAFNGIPLFAVAMTAFVYLCYKRIVLPLQNFPGLFHNRTTHKVKQPAAPPLPQKSVDRIF